MKIWLDATAPKEEGWVWCRRCDDVTHHLKRFNVTEISFNYDLGNGRTSVETIVHVIYLVRGGLIKPLKLKIHAANPKAFRVCNELVEEMKEVVSKL